MADFFAELKRRHIYRVGAAYVVVAWALTQFVEILAQVFTLPLWLAQTAIVLLAVGFPVALFVAWTIENKPHQAVASAVRSKPTIVDWTLCGALAVVMLLIGYQQIAPRSQANIAPASSTAQPGGISVAVLPFVNLSDDRQQEFFSDGMTEEITSALAKVSNLRVVGRTSAFQFKGENKDLRAIGQALSATHLIEGSVRKDGNEVRITAQLIQADDGTHLWTESYNRELKGVFAIQEEIAIAIASALRVPLGLKEGQSLVANRTSDTDSYQDYLRARALVRGRGPLEPGGPLTEAAKLLEQVVARDPNFAPAWGLLGYSYLLTPSFSYAVTKGSADEFRLIAADAYSKAEAAAQQAVRLDPNNVGGYTILALVQEAHGALVQAEDLFKRVLSLDPNDADALHQYGGMLALVGRLKDSLPMRMRLRAQEPLVPIFNTFTALVLYANGRNDEAFAILRASPPGLFARLFLAQIYSSMGHYSEAADALREIPSGMVHPGAMEEALRLLRTAPAKAPSTQTSWSNGFLGFVYLYVGAPDRALGWYESFVEAGYPVPGNGIAAMWTVSYAPVRKTERFKDYVRKIGLVDYWRARGWPDLCRPVGADDFACS